MSRPLESHIIVLNQDQQTITYDEHTLVLPFLQPQNRKTVSIIDKYCMFKYGRRFRVNTSYSEIHYKNIPADYPFESHKHLMREVYKLFNKRVFPSDSLFPVDNPDNLKIEFIPENLDAEKLKLKRYEELIALKHDHPKHYEELQVIDAIRYWLVGAVVFGDDNFESYIREPTPSDPFITKEEFERDVIPTIKIPQSRVKIVEKLFPIPPEIIVPDEWFDADEKEQQAFLTIRNKPYQHEKPKATIKYDSRQNDGYAYEMSLFKVYLNDLLNTLSIGHDIPTILLSEIRGRPEIQVHDKIFCNIDRINSKLTSRQYPMSDNARVALLDGYVQSIPSASTLSDFLLNEKLTPILNSLLQLSAAPLSACETQLAVDSSGFRTLSYGEWFRIKYDVELRKCLNILKIKQLKEEAKKEIKLMKKQRMRMWKKAHIIVGTKTGVIIAMKVTSNEGEGTSDTLNFKPLLEDATKYFDVQECSADKGYSSRYNFRIAQQYGIKLYCPFRSNSTIKQKGVKSWHDMFYMCANEPEEFAKHYNIRNNVESTFGAVKKALGEQLTNKSETGQINELYCKMIAFNIRKLIMANALELIDTPNFSFAESKG